MVIGRFAPSPTGPLHFGSLLAALASYLEAKTKQGKWLVRMEDLDKPREIKGAAAQILNTLEQFGLEWDGEVVYQSQRADLYQEVLSQLEKKHLIYHCKCSRKEIADSYNQKPAHQGVDGLVYPGTCRNQQVSQIPYASRIKVADNPISFKDAIQGVITQNLSTQLGDFVLKRADGIFAYQLAVVADDQQQGITQIVRGADLLDSTPRQIYLQQQLSYPTPQYAHIPVTRNMAGEKLSKQTLAPAIDAQEAAKWLIKALTFLGQNPPANLSFQAKTDILDWAKQHWQLQNIPKQPSIIFE
jgi:glutamyl-Q tRNA(Asp) synthetase